MRIAISFFLLFVGSFAYAEGSLYFETLLRNVEEPGRWTIVEITPEARLNIDGRIADAKLQKNREQAKDWRAKFFAYVKEQYAPEYGAYENIPAGFRADIECINGDETSIAAVLKDGEIIHLAVIAYGRLPHVVRLARAGYVPAETAELAPIWTQIRHQDVLGHIAPSFYNSLISSSRPYVGEAPVEIKLVIKNFKYRNPEQFPWTMYVLKSRVSAGIGMWSMRRVPEKFAELTATTEEIDRYLASIRPRMERMKVDPRFEDEIRRHARGKFPQYTALVGMMYAEAIGKAKIRLWEGLGMKVIWRGEDPDFSTDEKKVEVAVLEIHREQFDPHLGEKLATRIPDEHFNNMGVSPSMSGLCTVYMEQAGFTTVPLLGNSQSVVGTIVLR